MKYVRALLVLLVLVGIRPPLILAGTPAVKDWTLMVFLNGDNDLDPFAVGDQEEMAKVGSNEFVHVVTLIDRRKGPATLNYVEKGNVRPLEEMGEVDMGDYRLLVRFVEKVAAACPARHYALVVWNHGSGWDKARPAKLRGVSYDETSGNHITTAQLATAGGEIRRLLGKNLDIFAFDACYMAMMEIAFALRDGCDIVIASEDTEPGDGFPYDEILAGLSGGMEAPALARLMVDAYVSSYSRGSRGSQGIRDVCLSAILCSKLGALQSALDAVARAAMAVDVSPQFTAALGAVQSFDRSYGIDLAHFSDLVGKSCSDPGLRDAFGNLGTAVGEVVLASGNHGASMKDARGLAIYFPPYPSVFDPEYHALGFARDSLWDEMLLDYYRKTADTIVADVASGDISSLLAFVRSANANAREISAYLTSRLNFRLFCDSAAPVPGAETVVKLIAELKGR